MLTTARLPEPFGPSCPQPPVLAGAYPHIILSNFNHRNQLVLLPHAGLSDLSKMKLSFFTGPSRTIWHQPSLGLIFATIIILSPRGHKQIRDSGWCWACYCQRSTVVEHEWNAMLAMLRSLSKYVAVFTRQSHPASLGLSTLPAQKYLCCASQCSVWSGSLQSSTAVRPTLVSTLASE